MKDLAPVTGPEHFCPSTVRRLNCVMEFTTRLIMPTWLRPARSILRTSMFKANDCLWNDLSPITKIYYRSGGSAYTGKGYSVSLCTNFCISSSRDEDYRSASF